MIVQAVPDASSSVHDARFLPRWLCRLRTGLRHLDGPPLDEVDRGVRLAVVMLRRRMRATSIYCYLLVLAVVDTVRRSTTV